MSRVQWYETRWADVLGRRARRKGWQVNTSVDRPAEGSARYQAWRRWGGMLAGATRGS